MNKEDKGVSETVDKTDMPSSTQNDQAQDI
jgi:hypothetical protein